MTPERVPYPLFELVGPKCPITPCNGTLVMHVRQNFGWFQRCFTCGHETAPPQGLTSNAGDTQ